jgi:hypothetical protein
MKNLLILSFIFIVSSSKAQTVKSCLQVNAGISSPTQRWDKDFDVFSTFFTDIQSFSSTPGIRLYSKPRYHGDLNYIRNILNPITWKLGIYGSSSQIERTSGLSYAPDSSNIGLQELGAQAFLVKPIKAGSNHTILLQLGLQAGTLSISNNQLVKSSDTLDVVGIFEVIQESDLQMELVSSWLVQGVFRAEWLTELNEHWSLSAAAEMRLPLTSNTRFVGTSVIDNDFFPITTTTQTQAFSMPYWSFNLGVIRNFSWIKQTSASLLN